MASAVVPLIVIVGQTASGKSELALGLAERFDGEIICADSRTIYKGMDIGTAKPSEEDRKRVEHHLLDVVNPDERFNASRFKALANDSIKEISSRGKTAFLVGGTGLYISSVIYDFGFGKGNDNRLRDNCLIIGLNPDKEELRRRIKQRVDMMIAAGLEKEVRTLVAKYGFNAPGMNAICYKQWEEYLSGEQTMEALIQKLYTDNWQYARRQKTWFKRDNNIKWITSVEEAPVLAQQFLIQ